MKPKLQAETEGGQSKMDKPTLLTDLRNGAKTIQIGTGMPTFDANCTRRKVNEKTFGV